MTENQKASNPVKSMEVGKVKRVRPGNADEAPKDEKKIVRPS